MRRSSDVRQRIALVLVLVLAAACGGERETDGSGGATASEGMESATQGAADSTSDDPSARAARAAAPEASAEPASQAAAADAAVRPGLGGRARELVDPEPATVVALYHSLAQVPFPFERVVAEDTRVAMAKPIDKQAQRDAVRGELEAALSAVQDVGMLRLSLGANLSDYDPSFGEFTVRALAPSSVVTFDAFREHVELRFTNGLVAQTWKVPAEEAQLVRDKIGPMQNASAEVLVRITGVQPVAGGGGTIQTEVVEYELRAEPSGDRLARVRVAP